MSPLVAPPRRRLTRRLAMLALAVFMLIGVGADFIASGQAIVASRDGGLEWFGNLGKHGLPAERLEQGEWAIWAPIRLDPLAVRTSPEGPISVLESPSTTHWLGTDDRGRDVLARLIHGTRSTLVLAAGVAGLALVVGILLSFFAFSFGTFSRQVLLAIVDGMSGLPALLLVVAAQGLWGRGSVALAIVVLAVPRAAQTAHIAIARITQLSITPFAEAATALGVSRVRLFVRHLLPNAMPALWVATALTAAMAVLAEAALSFLGFGTPSPEASWGELLAQAHQNGLRWWLLVPAGVCATTLAAALGRLAISTSKPN